MLIAEPVQNGGGAFVPPPGYWAGLRALCDRYGIVLVADETITAFGRSWPVWSASPSAASAMARRIGRITTGDRSTDLGWRPQSTAGSSWQRRT